MIFGVFGLRADENIGRSQAQVLGQELGRYLYGAHVPIDSISCHMPVRVQLPGVFRPRVRDLSAVKVPVLQAALPTRKHLLKSLSDHPRYAVLSNVAVQAA